MQLSGMPPSARRYAACSRSMIADVLWRCAWCPRHRRLEVGKHLRQGHLLLLLRRCSPLRGRPRLRATWPAALASAPVSRGLRSPSNRASVPDQMILHGGSSRLVQAAGKALSANSLNAREKVASLGIARTVPAAQAPQRPVVGQPLDERPRGGDVEHRLGDEGARYGRTVVLRPASQLQGLPCAQPVRIDDSHERLVARPGTEVLLNAATALERHSVPDSIEPKASAAILRL